MLKPGLVRAIRPSKCRKCANYSLACSIYLLEAKPLKQAYSIRIRKGAVKQPEIEKKTNKKQQPENTNRIYSKMRTKSLHLFQSVILKSASSINNAVFLFQCDFKKV